jgi:phosphomevalonate kinase
MIVTERSLLDSLQAYVHRFEIPDAREDLLAIASSILTFQQKQGTIAIAPNQAETLIQQVVDKFKVKTGDSVVEATTDKLVQEVNQWRQSLENQVLNTLNAYAQKAQPEKLLDLLPDTILSILPLVESAQLRKSEAESLIQQVKSKFNLTNALAQVIDPKSLANAARLVQLLKFENLEKLLQDALLGNQDLINHTIENVTESLVENELAKILGSDAVNLDIDVDAQQLMIKQVTLKLNVMQSSAPPSKSNAEISAQMDDEIERFKSSRPLPFRLF